jgi:hypothetical protein
MSTILAKNTNVKFHDSGPGARHTQTQKQTDRQTDLYDECNGSIFTTALLKRLKQPWSCTRGLHSDTKKKIRIALSWSVTPCNLVAVYGCFSAAAIAKVYDFYPDYKGSRLLF